MRQRQARGYGSSSFVSTADAICAKAVAEHDGHPFPVSNFDSLHHAARDLPAVGMYISRYGDASASVARLDALAVPAEHHADWEKLRALIDQGAANAQRQITAERSNVTRFEQTVTIARSLAALRQYHECPAACLPSSCRPALTHRGRGAEGAARVLIVRLTGHRALRGRPA